MKTTINNLGHKVLKLLFILVPLLFLASCSHLPQQPKKLDSNYQQNYLPNTYLERKLSPLVKQHPNQTGFYLIANGIDAFAVRKTLIEKAEGKIDIQYYMIHEDKSGRKFFQLVKQAANRGVKIRLLIDDIHLHEESDLLKDADAHPNIEVRVFNPFSRKISRYPQYVFGLGKITRRMHNKAMIVDNQISIIGGRNIADEYFQQEPEVDFGDMDVIFIGPLIKEASKSFDSFWNSQHVSLLKHLEKVPKQSKPIEGEITKQSTANSYFSNALDKQNFHFSWAKATLIADKPEKITKKRNTKLFMKGNQINHYIAATKKEILVFTPYLVPTKTGIEHLKALRKRGVRVILFTNSLATTDVPFVHSGYIKYRESLVDLGVELYELKDLGKGLDLFRQLSNGKKVKVKKDSLHAKIMVFDRKKFYVGSMNIDPRSIYENTELGLIIESPKVAESIYHWFNQNINHLAYRLRLRNLPIYGEKVVWESNEERFLIKEPKTSIFTRIWMDFLSGLPIAENHL